METISFRVGYRGNDVELIGLKNLTEHQLSPGSPYIYCEKNTFLTSKDIIHSEIIQDELGYWAKIEFTKNAFDKLNSLIFNNRFCYLVLFIKDFPFYTLGLNGPFDSPTVILGPKEDLDEVELLISNINN